MRKVLKAVLEGLDLQVVRLSSGIGADHRWSIELLELAARDLARKLDRRLRVIQIGANDGDDEDPVKALIDDDMIEAVLVEPLPTPFETLTDRYAGNPHIHTRNAAIAETAGSLPIYLLEAADGSKAHKYSKMATLDRKLAGDRLARESKRDGAALRLRTIHVPTMRISDILGEMGWDHVDVVVIDAEGYDAKIVQALLAEGVPCKIIQFESVSIPRRDHKALIASLVNAGFLTARSGYDSIAIRQDR